MGSQLEFNWILKLKEKDIPKNFSLRNGKLEEFVKKGERFYPLQKPIFLVNENWKAIATVYVRDYHLSEGHTKGNYIIEKILNEKESSVLTNLFQDMYNK